MIQPKGDTIKCKCGKDVDIKLATNRAGTDGLVVTCPEHGVVARYKLREYDIRHWPPTDAKMHDDEKKEWKT